jgi:hypothetical protein
MKIRWILPVLMLTVLMAAEADTKTDQEATLKVGRKVFADGISHERNLAAAHGFKQRILGIDEIEVVLADIIKQSEALDQAATTQKNVTPQLQSILHQQLTDIKETAAQIKTTPYEVAPWVRVLRHLSLEETLAIECGEKQLGDHFNGLSEKVYVHLYELASSGDVFLETCAGRLVQAKMTIPQENHH